MPSIRVSSSVVAMTANWLSLISFLGRSSRVRHQLTLTHSLRGCILISLVDFCTGFELGERSAITDVSVSPKGEYIAATDLLGKVHLFSSTGIKRYENIPDVQFFPTDYNPLQYDQNHLAADDTTGVCICHSASVELNLSPVCHSLVTRIRGWVLLATASFATTRGALQRTRKLAA